MRKTIVFSAVLCAASVLVGTPALAQMKTGAPETPVAKPAPDAPEATTGSVATTDATGSVVAAVKADKPVSKEAPSGGFSLPSLPKIPMVDVSAGYEFSTGAGQANLVGFEKVSQTINTVPAVGEGVTTSVPGLGNASTAGSGNAFTLDIGLPLSFGVGARLQNLSLDSRTPAFDSLKNITGGTFDDTSTSTSTTTFSKPGTTNALLPTSYTDLYARFMMLKGGLRMEHYDGTPGKGLPAGDYTSAMGGLNLGLNLFDLVGANACLMSGVGLAKPEGLGDSVMHVPLDFDAYASLKLFMVKVRLGYHMVGAANADPSRLGDLMSVLGGAADPTKLAEINSNLQKASDAVDSIATNRVGMIGMPYLALEVNF